LGKFVGRLAFREAFKARSFRSPPLNRCCTWCAKSPPAPCSSSVRPPGASKPPLSASRAK
jgi:hypothetical protein